MKNIKIINEHSSYINFLLLLSDGRFASSSHDKTIKIFNMNSNYHCDINLFSDSINCNQLLELDNNKLVFCSSINVKIWSINQLSYQCILSFKFQSGCSFSKIIQLTNNRFASSSIKKSIKIWNSKHPYNLIKTLSRRIE